MITPASRVPVLALALSLVAFTACDKKDGEGEAKSDAKTDKVDDQKPADGQGGDTKTADAAKPDEVKPDGDGGSPTPTGTASGGDGVAYVAVNSRGLAKLDASGWSMILDDKRASFTKVLLGADGNVYVVDWDGVKKINGSSLDTVAKFDFNTFSGVSSIAVGKDGKIYGAGYNKYGVFADGKWTASELKDLGPEIDSLNGAALASDGTVWVGHSKGVLFNKGGTWAALDVSSLGDFFYPSQLSNSPTGEVFVTIGSHLVRLTPEKVEKIEFKAEGWASYSTDMAYNSKGHVLAASGSCELVRLDPANPGEQWTVKKGDYNCLSLQVAGLDDQNRAWVYSREGLSVIGPDKTVTEYPNSTVMEILGSYPAEIVVVGNGPALPAPGPVRTAGVTGKVLLEGTAVANSKIEMCATPSWGGSQPCFDSKVKFSGSTNDKGEFAFEAVPIGSYTMSVEISGKWQMYSPPNMSSEMKEGTTYDVGSVKLTAL